MRQKNIYISLYVDDLLKSKDFETSSALESTDLVRLTVEDLGFPQGATTDHIYAKATELGLDLCPDLALHPAPADGGTRLRLAYTGTDWMYIAMKQITGRDGNPRVFILDEGGGELRLGAGRAGPDRRWDSDFRFGIRLRKKLACSEACRRFAFLILCLFGISRKISYNSIGLVIRAVTASRNPSGAFALRICAVTASRRGCL